MKRLVAFLVIVFCTFSAYANLVIHITQGVNKPYPIAILDFSQSPVITKQLPNGFVAIIKGDLRQSGRFSVEDKKSLPFLAASVSQFPWARWLASKNNAEYVLVGSITPGKPGTEDVTYQLLSVYGNRSLTGKQFQNVPKASLRFLAHQISDEIFQTITGVRGQFNTKLAYVTVNRNVRPNAYRLVIADADGFDPQTLLYQTGEPIASPRWSADGKQLAYVTYLNNRMAIYTITLATGKRHLIANFPGLNSAPAFSPNGKSMAMALSMGKGSDTDLYLMNLTSQKLSRLTHLGTNTSPSFSPDGKNIVFTSNRGGRPQIYQVNLKSKIVKRLSYEGVQNFSPQYTPDGAHIVMMHQEEGGGPIRIALLNPNSGYTQTITSGDLDKSPSVSPNGMMVVYANYGEANGILEETSITGRIRLQLPATEGSVQSPAWSPFIT